MVTQLQTRVSLNRAVKYRNPYKCNFSATKLLYLTNGARCGYSCNLSNSM